MLHYLLRQDSRKEVLLLRLGLMKPKKRQKLCHHCEGEVDLDVIVCPFCAADLREERRRTEKVEKEYRRATRGK